MRKTVFAAIAAGGLIVHELYRYVWCRDAGFIFPRLLDKKGHAEAYYTLRDSAADALRQRPCLKYSIISDSGKTLRGFYYPAGDRPCGKIAFIVHGYRAEHAEAAGMYYDYYKSRGIDLFCCDHAGAGESEGRLISFDYYESRDCLKWLDFLREEFGSGISVILHGFSMGGGTVLKMSDRCGENVRFIVSDSGFASGAEVLRRSLSAVYKPMNFINRLVAGYFMEQTDVRQNLRNARCPVLFIHGTEDPTVPFYMGEELYELCPTEKDKLFIEGAKHVECMYLEPEKYAEKLDCCIQRYMN